MDVRSSRVRVLLGGVAGFAISVSAAGALTATLRHQGMADLAPWLFLLLVPFVARFLGSPGAMIGVVAAALIFSAFLFPPLGTPNIGEKPARESLLLMLTLGIPAAYLLGRAPHSTDQDPQQSTSEPKD
jgi:K+-sensing histidine kinase KdpD